ncbi:hypothetical protein BGX34_010557 [Mortierella sp. NVP85]|nr:hypothetical protein BGX34_010557 [Mortierella sp. NVP85]
MLRIATSPLRRFPSVRLHQQRSTFGSAITPRPSSYLAPLSLSDEVRSALDAKKPLVALESTIISHGMPYPQNFETAIEVEKIVRDNGATPATIAIIEGQVQIGLSQDQIRHLAKLGRAAVKASRRDMAVVMSKKQTGATTVSATMLLAHRAGISVFATGGIGGVHRGYENTMDASADLTELGRTPVAVVCAGVKSILDIGRTLEFLETQGVTVATFGLTTDFPAFFTRTSGFHSMLNIETPMEAAELIAANHAIDLQSGIVIGVPIPEADAMDDDLVGAAIDTAVKESIEQKIFGKESTPFLLKRVNELTGGNSLKSNIALVKQNASVAARIAKDLSTLNYRPSYQARSYSTNVRSSKHYQAGQGPIMVIGGTVVDITATAHEASSMLNSSFPGTARISLGGVGRNVAEGICKLHANGCVFVSAVGGKRKHQDSAAIAAGDATDDLFGSWLVGEIERKGIVREAITKHQPKTVCFDANLSVESIRAILETCKNQDVQTFFEPTSVAKCDRPLDGSMMNTLLDGALSFASPNEYELQKMALSARKLISDHKGHVHLRGLSDRPVTNALHDPEDVAVMPDENMAYKGLLLDALSVSQFIPTLFIKLGPKGVLVFQRTRRESPQDRSPLRLEDWRQEGAVRWQWFPALKVENIKSVTGAGDSFVASVVTNLHNLEKTLSPQAGFENNDPFWDRLGQIIQDGQTAATLTMQTYETVSPSLAQSVQAQRHVLAKA